MAASIVFIDPRVWNWRSLVADLPPDSIWHLLDEHSDGVAQMQAFLAGYRDLASIQIISHGSAGAFYIGSSAVNAASLSSYSSQWAAIGSALSETGDLLLYGCDVAAGERGEELIRQLAALTGADVAASVDKTGAAALGGNWVLETQTGSIEASLLNGTGFQSTLVTAVLGVAESSANKAEGNSGSTPFTFTITRTGDTTGASSTAWAVTGSGTSAASAADFVGGILPSGTVSFAAGETVKTIIVDVVGDTVVESDESFTVTLSSPSVDATIDTATATGVIYNDDARLSIAALFANNAEGQSGSTAFLFKVTRSGDTTGSSTANWTVTGSGVNPANAQDFAGGVLPSGTVIFAAGEVEKLITVNVAGDTLAEASEVFRVTLSSPTGATLGTASASGTIRADDTNLSIVATSSVLAEGQTGDTAFTFTVSRSGVTTGMSSAAWAVTGSGADAADAADFSEGVLPSGTVTFAAGETSRTITVNVAGDSSAEANEGFTVALSNSTGATLATGSALGTIRNDDTNLSIVAVSGVQAEGQSGDTTFTFTVARSGDTTGASSVVWAVAGSGAAPVNAADFSGGVLPSGTVNFASGETSKTITLNVAGDITVEQDEAFTVTLSSPTGATPGSSSQVSGTIQNDDIFTAAAITDPENQFIFGSHIYQVVRAPMRFAEALDESMNMRIGDISGHLVTVTSRAEQAAVSSFVAPLFQSGFITDGLWMALSDAQTEGQWRFVGGPEIDSAPIYTLWGTGELKNSGAGEDFATLRPSMGGTWSDVADGLFSFIVEFEPSSSPAPELSIAARSANKTEGQSGSTAYSFTVTRSGDTSGVSSATWVVAGSSSDAANAADFAGNVFPSGTVIFSEGQTSKVVTVNVSGDAKAEATEGFTIALKNPIGAILGTASATGSIVNDDNYFGAELIRNGSFEERKETWPVTGTQWSTIGTPNGANDGMWTNSPNIWVAFDEDEANGIDNVPGWTNAVDLFGRTGTFDLLFNAAYNLQPTSGGVVLELDGTWPNHDPQPDNAVLDGGTHAYMKQSLAASVTGPLLFGFNFADTDPTSSDFGVFANDKLVLSLAKDQQSSMWISTFRDPAITIEIGDVDPSDGASGWKSANVYFAANLGEVHSIGFQAGVWSGSGFDPAQQQTQGGTLIDSVSLKAILPSSLSIAATSASKVEGSAVEPTPFVFTVTRSGDTAEASSAKWEVTGRGAAPADATDFSSGVLPSGTVSFAAGETSKTIVVDVAADTGYEFNEGFAISLSNPVGSALGVASALGTIRNDDAKLSIIPTSADKAEGSAGLTPFTFTVKRSGDISGPSYATWSVIGSGPNAASPSDFEGGSLPSGSVSFLAGEKSKVITVSVLGDTVLEADESFTVLLSNSMGNPLGTAAGTIRFDEGYNKVIVGTPSINVLTGTSGADRIVALGGNDAISGFVNADLVDGGSGSDTLLLKATSVHLNMASDAQLVNLEVVDATQAAAGVTIDLSRQSEALSIWGSTEDDVIVGGTAGDTLFGGLGDDTLEGKAGNDTFVFDTAIVGGGNVDIILDFVTGNDRIQLAAEVFNGLSTGPDGELAASAFALNTATGVAAQIVYETATGKLSYDSNGAGAGGATQFANLSSPTGVIDHHSFWLV